jgi:5-methylcytosine-specific restriction endonuclease McrA
MNLPHGPGAYADPDGKPQRWGGRRAQDYTRRTLQEYGDLCIICGTPGADTADHVIPRAEGGAVYDLTNLGPAHSRCNSSRGKRPLRPLGIPIENGMKYFT